MWALRVCSKLSAPLTVAAGMFLFLYLNGVSTITSISADTTLSFTQAMRLVGRLPALLASLLACLLACLLAHWRCHARSS
jgi:hypothetical protein